MYPKIEINTKKVPAAAATDAVTTPLEINQKMKKILLIKDGFTFFTRKDDTVVVNSTQKNLCKPILSTDGYEDYTIYKKNIRDFFNFDDVEVKNEYFLDFDEKVGNFDRDYYFIILPDVVDEDLLVKALSIEKDFYYLVNLTGDNLESYLSGVLVRHPFDERDGREIEGVPGVIGKGANAPFAEDDITVALGHDVLGGHQQLFKGG